MEDSVQYALEQKLKWVSADCQRHYLHSLAYPQISQQVLKL